MMKRLLYFVMAALMVLAVSCKKEPKVQSPSVKTLEATDIQITGATLNGEIDLADGEYNSITCGFYWGAAEDALDTYLEGGDVTDGTFSASLTGLSPETQYWYKAYAELDDRTFSGEVKSFTTNPLPEGAVDLGIVMTREDGTTYNLYWAKSNLCEDGLCPNPEDYGDYYAWGETAPHYSSRDPLVWKSGKTGGYTWASYSLCDASSAALNKYNYNTSYGIVDNMTEFKDYGYVHDAARANKKLGGKWRIPTVAEWTELRTKCTWMWTSQNGVNGRLVTAPNGKRIFLPAAGKWEWTNLSNDGINGGCWSSSLFMGGPVDACYVYFDSEDVGGYSYNRCFGFSVRPVYEE